MLNPKMHIIWRTLEAAKDVKDLSLIAACRRLIVANRRGWKRFHVPADYTLVLSFN